MLVLYDEDTGAITQVINPPVHPDYKKTFADMPHLMVEETKTVMRQKTREVTDSKTVIEIVDGEPVQKITTETVIEKVFDHRPVKDENGKRVVKPAGITTKGKQIFKPVLHPVPVMEAVEIMVPFRPKNFKPHEHKVINGKLTKTEA